MSLCTYVLVTINMPFFRVNLEVHNFRNVSEISRNNTTLSEVMPNNSSKALLWWTISRQTCVTVYTVVTFTVIVVVFVRCVLFVNFFTNTSMNLHNNMFNAIIRATMYFFDTNSSGNSLIYFKIYYFHLNY